jgi:hypothetical protein
MHPDCTDVWEILETGVLQNVARGKCIGRDESNAITRIRTVGCDSEKAESWSVVDSQYEVFNVHFKTFIGWENSVSTNLFEIDGYGEIPHDCHTKLGTECDIQNYGMKTFTIRARGGGDGWAFRITGDIGELLSYETVPGGTHYQPFPTRMDNDEYDVSQTYSLKMDEKNNYNCYDIHLKTLDASNTTSNDESSFTTQALLKTLEGHINN